MLTPLPLPPVIRAAAELATATAAYHAEDHPEVVAAQTIAGSPEPSTDAVCAWDDALSQMAEAANRLKRALGATGELSPARRVLDGGDAPEWPNFRNDFADVEHPRTVRVGLKRLAIAAIDLSGYAALRRPVEEWRAPALRQITRGIQQLWPALSPPESESLHGCLLDLRDAIGWPGTATDAPPAWAGPVDLLPEELSRTIDMAAGFYARPRDELQVIQSRVIGAIQERHAAAQAARPATPAAEGTALPRTEMTAGTQAGRATTFRVLRDEFLTASRSGLQPVHLDLPPSAARKAIDSFSPWMQRGGCSGSPPGVERFVQLAARAGDALTVEFVSAAPLFPSPTGVDLWPTSGMMVWAEFLFVACCTSFECDSAPGTDNPVSAHLKSGHDPFLLSAEAIDNYFIPPPPRMAEFWEFRDAVAPWAKATTARSPKAGAKAAERTYTRDSTKKLSANPLKKTKGKNIDARMLKLLADDTERYYWSARQFAVRLDCGAGTVKGTKAWLQIIAYRAAEAARRVIRIGELNGGKRKNRD